MFLQGLPLTVWSLDGVPLSTSLHVPVIVCRVIQLRLKYYRYLTDFHVTRYQQLPIGDLPILIIYRFLKQYTGAGVAQSV
jgi:hypothetical protein